MLTVRNILIALIWAAPVTVAWDGLIVQGVVAGIVAVALVITARNLRPGETEFLVSVIRAPLVVAAIPALWVLLQALPLGVLAHPHPIWISAEKALGHPIHGAVSVDPGASLIALGHYLSMCAVAFLSAAVAVDRQRAEWTLLSLTAATAAIALIVLVLSGIRPSQFPLTSATTCASLGVIIATAACLRAIERYETRRVGSQQSGSNLLLIFAGSIGALVLCVAALFRDATYWTIFATGCGLAALVCVWIIRRFELGSWSATAIAVTVLGVALLVMAYHPPRPGASIPLTYAESSAPLITLSQRILDDAPLLGTGAGTFASLAPIYREIDEPPPGSVAATTAATFAIEFGKPMFWLITLATAAYIFILLQASLHRGRDSFYSAMGGSCLITLLFLAFTNSGLLGTGTELIFAAVFGLALAQSKSRTAQL